jgi:hypothetical protein
VHDKPDDKLNLIKYDYNTRNFGGLPSVTLVSVGGCGPGLREEKPAARSIAATPEQKQCPEATGKITKISKQGTRPALFFVDAYLGGRSTGGACFQQHPLDTFTWIKAKFVPGLGRSLKGVTCLQRPWDGFAFG